jgi:hypothetical protein
MKRLFWALVGLGLGAVVGIQVARWASKTKQRYSPQNIARETAGSLQGVGQRIRDAIEAGLEEMAEREVEIRAEFGLPPRRG